MITAENPNRTVCQCCGRGCFAAGALYAVKTPHNGEEAWRCPNHSDRNPCAIEGCRRTTAMPCTDAGGKYPASDGWLCSEHWRAYVPPHSRERRAYHRFWRTARKYGWSPSLDRRFWRFWDGLVQRARRRHGEGFIDVDKINEMFGWSE